MGYYYDSYQMVIFQFHHSFQISGCQMRMGDAILPPHYNLAMPEDIFAFNN